MKYNYLLTLRVANEKCKSSTSGQKTHNWDITTNVRATVGDYCAVDFYCRRCNKRHTEWFSREEYKTKIKNIVEEIENAQDRAM